MCNCKKKCSSICYIIQITNQINPSPNHEIKMKAFRCNRQPIKKQQLLIIRLHLIAKLRIDRSDRFLLLFLPPFYPSLFYLYQYTSHILWTVGTHGFMEMVRGRMGIKLPFPDFINNMNIGINNFYTI